MFQLTRPRGARLTHTADSCDEPAFQLTRPRGARQPRARARGNTNMFQLTRPRGARPRSSLASLRLQSVSTHAPARGATVDAINTALQTTFQLTRPRGARPILGIFLWREVKFQLTRPRGARLRAIFGTSSMKPFQLTRPRGARRGLPGLPRQGDSVSTHAPARGATR